MVPGARAGTRQLVNPVQVNVDEVRRLRLRIPNDPEPAAP
jgi:hypothetical protein